jgi:hypothetical protein
MLHAMVFLARCTHLYLFEGPPAGASPALWRAIRSDEVYSHNQGDFAGLAARIATGVTNFN